jgi:hypothetical protein
MACEICGLGRLRFAAGLNQSLRSDFQVGQDGVSPPDSLPKITTDELPKAGESCHACRFL